MRARRYLAAAAYLLLSIVPLVYAAFSILGFFTPNPIRIGPPIAWDWFFLAVAVATILSVGGGWFAYSRNNKRMASSFLAAAYLPLVTTFSMLFLGL